ncbi:MAG: TPM domain-containing protein [Succiniclasticum sp.]
MKRILLLAALLLQAILLPLAAADAAAEIPAKPPAGDYVLDQAGILSAETEKKINVYSRALDKRTKAQIAILTVKDLGGESPDEYALAVLRKWGIGDKKLNNGVLILVSVGDRRSRIEVGYGLEGTLTDGTAGRIQDQYMLPYFRQGNYERGIVNGYNAVLQTVLKEYGLELKNLDVSSQNRLDTGTGREIHLSDLMAVAVFVLFFFIFFTGGFGGGSGGGGFRRGGRGGIFYGGGFGGFGGGGFGGGSGGGFGGGSGGGGGAGRGW